MILEGLMSTVNADGSVNLAPMGPVVDDAAALGADLSRLVLRPYATSQTYVNLKRSGVGVFHITDDVELLARAALDSLAALPPLETIAAVETPIVADCCRWYAVRVVELDDSQERTHIVADVVDRGRRRDFQGFNRAKHAVLEAAILATRLHLLPRDEVLEQLHHLQILVDKTGGPRETAAFAWLCDYVATHRPAAIEP